MSDEEINSLREGLLKRLENLKKSYGEFTHKSYFDTLVIKRKKETLEKEMAIVEKDLEKLNNRNVIVDFTR